MVEITEEKVGTQERLTQSTTGSGSEKGDMAMSDNQESAERQLLTFDEDMWDQLDRVAAYQKSGSSMVLGLQTFASGYKTLVKQFADGLTKCALNFEKDMFNVMRSQDYSGKRSDSSDLEFSTLSIAITGVRSGVDILARLMDDAALDIVGDLVEPLDTYYKHYN